MMHGKRTQYDDLIVAKDPQSHHSVALLTSEKSTKYGKSSMGNIPRSTPSYRQSTKLLVAAPPFSSPSLCSPSSSLSKLTSSEDKMHVKGAVAVPSIAKAALVMVIVFNVFGNALVFCVFTFLSYYLLMEYGSSEEDRADALKLEELELRWQQGALSFNDSSRYAVRKLAKVYERICALSQSVVAYSVKVSTEQDYLHGNPPKKAIGHQHLYKEELPPASTSLQTKYHPEQEEFLHLIAIDLFQDASDDITETTPVEVSQLDVLVAGDEDVIQQEQEHVVKESSRVPTFATSSITSPAIRLMMEEADKMMAEMAEMLSSHDVLKDMDSHGQALSDDEDVTNERTRTRSSVHFCENAVECLDMGNFEFDADLFYEEKELEAIQAEYFSAVLPEYM